MKLYEFEGKSLFRKMDIPTPRGYVARDLEEAKNSANKLGYPVAIKSQVLGGGRGKAGGIKFARSEDKFVSCVNEMFGKKCGDEKVEKLLIEEKLSIAVSLP